jgi:hypothetical protein
MTEISAGYFPDFDVQWDYKLSRKYKTQIKESVSGAEQRRRMFPPPEAEGGGHKGGFGYLEASSTAFTLEQRYQVVSFFDSMEGAFRAFYFFRRDIDKFVNYYVGEAIAQASIIIPFKDVTVTDVTVNSVSKPFTVTNLFGAGGESKINFSGGIQTGSVSVDLTGRERWLVRALNDEVVEQFIANVVKDNTVVPLSFKQLKSL